MIRRLTQREAHALAVILANGQEAPLPHGVYRALVCRGLLTGKHELTAEGREAFGRCNLLSRHFRDVLLGGRVVDGRFQPWETKSQR